MGEGDGLVVKASPLVGRLILKFSCLYLSNIFCPFQRVRRGNSNRLPERETVVETDDEVGEEDERGREESSTGFSIF